MSIDLELTGQLDRLDDRLPAERLTEMGDRLSAGAGEDLVAIDIVYDDSDPVLYAQLHPSAEYLALQCTQRGELNFQARTSTVGPGYHEFLCELLDDLAENCELSWSTDSMIGGDPTGFLSSRDRGELEDAFLTWLQQVGQQMVKLAADGFVGFAISMPTGVLYEHDGLLITPLGPRSVDWAIAVAEDPQRGTDIFPWWRRERDAEYHVNRAIAEMWTDVRWRAPLTDDENATLQRISNSLIKAWRLDPESGLPWREWKELLDVADVVARQTPDDIADDVRQKASQLDDDAERIGYRRHDVRVVALPGDWSISVPGVLAEDWEDESTWRAFDQHRSVSVTSFVVQFKAGGEPTADDLLQHAPEAPHEVSEILPAHENGPLKSIASYSEATHEGRPLRLLNVRAAVPGRLVAVTIAFDAHTPRSWAEQVWHSIGPPPDDEPEQ